MPSGDTAYPYDFVLNADGQDYGFMLTTPQNQTKTILFTEAEGPDPQRLVTQDTGLHQDFNPRIDTPFAMANFTGGCGQLEYDFVDETGYWWSSGVVTHVSGRVYLAPPVSSLALTGVTGNLTNFCTYIDTSNNRYDFLWEGANIWRRDAANATNAWTKVYTASVSITDFKIMDSVGLIAVPTLTGTTDFLYQSNILAAATWTPTTANHAPFSDALGKPAFFQTVRGTCYAVRQLSGISNGVFYTIDPTTDSWSGPIDTTLSSGNISGPPGDETYPTVGTRAVGDFYFQFKKDAAYSIDSQQDVLEVIWQWKDKPSEENFKYTFTCAEQLGFNIGPEVYLYDPQTGLLNNTFLSRRDGFSVKKIDGAAADNQYIYILAKVRVPFIRSADCEVLFRGTRQRGNTWAFEVLWEDTDLSTRSYGVLSVVPFGVGSRIYFGRNDSGDTDTMVMDIPASWDESSSGAFTTSASLYSSISRAGFPGFYKRHLFYNDNLLNYTATDNITVYYTTTVGASYALLGLSDTAQNEFDFSNTNGTSIGFRWDFVSAGTNSPIMLNFDHHQRVRFKYLPSAKMSVRVASNLRVRNNGVLNKNSWDIWDDIVTLRTTNSEITYRDFLGNSFPVTVDLIGVQPTRHMSPVEYEMEAVLMITRATRGS